MPEKLIISRGTVLLQKIVLCIAVPFFLLISSVVVIDPDFYSLVFVLLVIVVFLPFCLHAAKFYDIRIEDGRFKMRNVFKPSIDMDVYQFDKITIAKALLWKPKVPYFILHFKNGSQFHFGKNQFGNFKDTFIDPKLLAEQQTQEIRKYLQDVYTNSFQTPDTQ